MRSSILICAALTLAPAFAHAEEDDRPHTKMASPALMGGGIAVTALGASAMPWGVLFSAIHSAPACAGAVGCGSSGPDPLNVVGWSIIGGASALIVGGVTMIIFGARQVPVSVGVLGPQGTPGTTLRLTF